METNRRLTARYHGQQVTTELLRRIGPRCAVEVNIRDGHATVQRIIDRQRSIHYMPSNKWHAPQR